MIVSVECIKEQEYEKDSVSEANGEKRRTMWRCSGQVHASTVIICSTGIMCVHCAYKEGAAR